MWIGFLVTDTNLSLGW